MAALASISGSMPSCSASSQASSMYLSAAASAPRSRRIAPLAVPIAIVAPPLGWRSIRERHNYTALPPLGRQSELTVNLYDLNVRSLRRRHFLRRSGSGGQPSRVLQRRHGLAAAAGLGGFASAVGATASAGGPAGIGLGATERSGRPRGRSGLRRRRRIRPAWGVGFGSLGPLLANTAPCASEAAMVAPSVLNLTVASVADWVQVR